MDHNRASPHPSPRCAFLLKTLDLLEKKGADASPRSNLTLECHCWPSGRSVYRSGAGWGRSGPWVGGGLCGALRRQGRRSSRRRHFRAYPPLGCKSQKFGLNGCGVLKSVKCTELCFFDSESSEKKLLSIKYVFLECFFCGLPTLLIVGSVYFPPVPALFPAPFNTDHSLLIVEVPV
jgi:hypothetical protein